MNFQVAYLRGHLIALLSGAFAVLAFSPYHHWWILGIVTGVFYLTLEHLPARIAAWRGFFFGLGFFGTGVSWVYISIHLFGNASPVLAVFLTALFIVLLAIVSFPLWCGLYRFVINRAQPNGIVRVLLFSSLWVLGEGVRSTVFTGFPWLLSGYALIDTPVAWWASVTGVFGVSFLMTLTSVTIFHWIKNIRQLSASFLFAVCLMLILVAWPVKQLQWTKPDGISLSFSAVQGDIPQKVRWDQYYMDKIIGTYVGLSRDHMKNNFIIWPENAIPIFYQSMPELMDSLNQHLKAHDSTLLFGVPWQKGSRYYNSAVVLGQGSGHYFKQKLVPFGEYLPFDRWLRGLITFFDLPMSSFSRGEGDQALVRIKGYPVAVYICYEAVYPDFAARLAKGSAFIVSMSNDSWFGQSAGPWQHFEMVRMRALETGRYVINVTNDSATSLIGPDGKVIREIPPFHKGILHGRIQPVKGMTPFMRYHSWPVFVFCVLCLGIAFRKRLKVNAK